MMSMYVGIETLEKYLFIQVRVNKWLYDLTMSRTKTTRVSHMSNNTLTLTIWPAILYPKLVVHVKCTQMNADCIVHKDNTYTTLTLYKYMNKHTHTTHWHTQMHINMHTYIYTGIHTDTQTHTYTLTHTAYNKKKAYRHSYA